MIRMIMNRIQSSSRLQQNFATRGRRRARARAEDARIRVDARRTSKREADQLRASARRLLTRATAAGGCMLLLYAYRTKCRRAAKVQTCAARLQQCSLAASLASGRLVVADCACLSPVRRASRAPARDGPARYIRTKQPAPRVCMAKFLDRTHHARQPSLVQ